MLFRSWQGRDRECMKRGSSRMKAVRCSSCKAQGSPCTQGRCPQGRACMMGLQAPAALKSCIQQGSLTRSNPRRGRHCCPPRRSCPRIPRRCRSACTARGTGGRHWVRHMEVSASPLGCSLAYTSSCKERCRMTGTLEDLRRHWHRNTPPAKSSQRLKPPRNPQAF